MQKGIDSARGSQPVRALSEPIKVWDLGVRVFHWSLVIGVAASLLTGFFASRPWLDLHIIVGTLVAFLLVFRLVWGLYGSTYARFKNFIPTPLAVIRHGWQLLRRKAPHHVGHNPLGAAMILVLLFALLALTLTGLMAWGGVLKEGPLAPFMSFSLGQSTAWLHIILSYMLLGLIAMHVLGVLGESWRENTNLIAAMITGRKRISAGDGTGAIRMPPVAARPWLSTSITVGICSIAAPATAYYSLLPAQGVPTAPLPPLYASECGDCHSAHHPSLAPKASWSAIMRGLDDHFGENATLEPEDKQELTSYLTANAAEVWDSKAANMFRTTGAGNEALRITDTPGWRQIHDAIPDTVFKAKPVSGKLNCSKCHSDATKGVFAPRAITIPKEVLK